MTFVFVISQPLSPCVAVVLPLTTIVIHKLSTMEESIIKTNKNYPQTAPVIESKMDKMILTDQQIEDLNIICYKLQRGWINSDKVVITLSGWFL